MDNTSHDLNELLNDIDSVLGDDYTHEQKNNPSSLLNDMQKNNPSSLLNDIDSFFLADGYTHEQKNDTFDSSYSFYPFLDDIVYQNILSDLLSSEYSFEEICCNDAANDIKIKKSATISDRWEIEIYSGEPEYFRLFFVNNATEKRKTKTFYGKYEFFNFIEYMKNTATRLKNFPFLCQKSSCPSHMNGVETFLFIRPAPLVEETVMSIEEYDHNIISDVMQFNTEEMMKFWQALDKLYNEK